MKITQEDIQRYVDGDAIDPEMELAIKVAVEQDTEVAEWYSEAVGHDDNIDELGVAAVRASLETIDQSLWVPLIGDNVLAADTPQSGVISWTPEQTGRFTLKPVNGTDFRLTFENLPDGWKPASLAVFHRQAITATHRRETTLTSHPRLQDDSRVSNQSIKSLSAQGLGTGPRETQPLGAVNQRYLVRSGEQIQTWFTVAGNGLISLGVSVIHRGLLTAPAKFRLELGDQSAPFVGVIQLQEAKTSQLIERLQDDDVRKFLQTDPSQSQVDDESAAIEGDEFIAGLEDSASKDWLRAECARGLTFIGGDEARDALVRHLNDDAEASQEVRIACAESLGALAGEAERDALLEWWKTHPPISDNSSSNTELQTAVERALSRCAELYVGRQQLIGLSRIELNETQWTLHIDVAPLERVTLTCAQFRDSRKQNMTVIPLHQSSQGTIFDGRPRESQRELCFDPNACRVLQIEMPRP